MGEPLNTTPESTVAEADDSRYVIERKIGSGGAGTVYLARDRETGEQVALKRLYQMDAKSVLRLKREFRALVDINHPHIIKLYDMGRAGDGWFLTMEYVEGTDLSSYLAASASEEHPDAVRSSRQRLLASFAQLARGIHALHQAGMLHRDLKPSNVLVVDHRVVVLDFGLVRELDLHAASVTEDGTIAGTPAYMAPEQLMGQELTAASDWYAFGVMLYEAISGHLPLEGLLLEVLRRKLDEDPTPIHELATSMTKDVLDLCMALLHRDPARRPGAERIIDLLSRSAEQPANQQTQPQPGHTFRTETEASAVASALFGRRNELAALWNALVEAEKGRAVVVHVRGASGAGKSAVVEHFLDKIETPDSAATRTDALVLRSRCYELEAMPFKALDGVIDALVRHLSHLSDLEVGHFLPQHVAALIQLFPVLGRLGAVTRLLELKKLAPDAILDRQRAEAALRNLLQRVASQQPVVVWIDDLQWGDLDSARILQNWLQRPIDAPILFVFSYRTEEVTTSSCLLRLLQHEENVAATARTAEHTIDIGVLTDSDIRALCENRLKGHAHSRAAVVERIVCEAQGSPYLASQLTAVAEAKFARGDTDWSGLTIDALVAQTSGLLPQGAKTLLALLAVAGKPLAPKLVLRAAGVHGNGRALVHALRGLNLVRTREVNGERMLAVYHDRVRESVSASLTENERLLTHGSLLRALSFSDKADPDFLHMLALGAGEPRLALGYGHAAAERANASLAFERAAEVYRRCIDLAEASEVADLWKKLAIALGRCGRGLPAADAYLEAAKRVPVAEAVALTQMAAGHLLRTGHFEQAEALVNEVVADMGIRVPASDRGVAAALMWERTLLKFRGMDYRLRDPREVPPELLAQHDLFENLGSALMQFDPRRASLFHLRGLRCALDAGEPGRLVHALCRVATSAALEATPRGAQESDGMVARAEKLARESATQAQGVIASTRVFTSYHLGRHLRVVEFSEAALQALRTDLHADTRGNYYRRSVLGAMRLGSLYIVGRYKLLCTELATLLEETRDTDNLALLLSLAFVQAVSEEILDTCGAARSRLEQQRQKLPRNRFGTLHVIHMSAVITAACSTSDYAMANECLDLLWDRYMHSAVGRASSLGLALHAARARALLNQHVLQGESAQRLVAIRRDCAWLTKHASSMAANRVAARLAHIDGDHDRAIALLTQAVSQLDELNMAGDAARDRYALGVLLGGDQGRTLCDAAQQRLRDLGVVNPVRMLRAYYPEFIAPE